MIIPSESSCFFSINNLSSNIFEFLVGFPFKKELKLVKYDYSEKHSKKTYKIF